MDIQQVIDFVEHRLNEYEGQQREGLRNSNSLHKIGENRGRVLATLDILSYLEHQQKGNN